MTEFKPDLLSVLHDVARLGRVIVDKRARMHDMTRAQWVMMLWLERKPGITQKELSDLLEVEPITVARLVDRLEQRGMVERRADPADRRIWRLHLLPEAVPLLTEIKAERAEIRRDGGRRRRPGGAGHDDGWLAADAHDALRRSPRQSPAGRCARGERASQAKGEGSRLMASATTAPRVIEKAPARLRRRVRLLRPILMIGGIVVVAIGGFTWWITGGRYVSIDDAYVQAAMLSVSTDVSGLVAEVDVHEGERVHKGQVLFSLDPRQFQIALAGAKADLVQAGLTIDAMKRDYQRMLRDIQAKAADVANDQANYGRYANLVKSGAVTRAEYDAARFKLAADKEALSALREQAQMQLAKLQGDPNLEAKTAATYLAAKARVDEAQRQLNHSVVRAPFAGVVTNVDKLQPGQYLAASTGAFGLVSADRVWVEANPKETELTWVKPGNPATVDVDTYPGQAWHGVVETIAPNSGSEFSILPAQNSSGNWVKVVQRIPLRVRVDRRPGDPPLRAGMSVEVTIDTGHHRTLADLF